jgi:hypothetical protein
VFGLPTGVNVSPYQGFLGRAQKKLRRRDFPPKADAQPDRYVRSQLTSREENYEKFCIEHFELPEGRRRSNRS